MFGFLISAAIAMVLTGLCTSVSLVPAAVSLGPIGVLKGLTGHRVGQKPSTYG